MGTSQLRTHHNATPRCSATAKMSLSAGPRVHHDRDGPSGAILATYASMRRLQRRDDAFDQLDNWNASSASRSVEHIAPGRDRAARLGADAGVVEPGRNGWRITDLSRLVLQEIGAVAVEHAGLAAVQRGRVQAGLDAVPGPARRRSSPHRDRETGGAPHRVRLRHRSRRPRYPAGDPRPSPFGCASPRRSPIGSRAPSPDRMRGRLRSDHVKRVRHGDSSHAAPRSSRLSGSRFPNALAPPRRRAVSCWAFAARCRWRPYRATQAGRGAAGGRRRDPVLAGAGLGDDPGLFHAPCHKIWPRTLLILSAPVWLSIALQVKLGAAECRVSRSAKYKGSAARR